MPFALILPRGDQLYCVCVYVCVVIPFILNARLLLDAPAEVTRDFATFLLRCLHDCLSRKGFSRPFPPSTVRSKFVYPRNNRFSLVGHGCEGKSHFNYAPLFPRTYYCYEVAIQKVSETVCRTLKFNEYYSTRSSIRSSILLLALALPPPPRKIVYNMRNVDVLI